MRIAAVLIVLALLAIPAKAQEFAWENPWSEYRSRLDTMTTGAGDAKAANSAIHAINPRPAHAWKRRFPASGERMSGAIRRYQDVTKLQEAAHSPLPEQTSSGSSDSSSSGGK